MTPEDLVVEARIRRICDRARWSVIGKHARFVEVEIRAAAREAAERMKERCSMLAAGHFYDVLAAKIRALHIEEDEGGE